MQYLSRNLPFRAIMDLAQKFDGVTCDTTVSVSELDENRKYRILQARRLTTRFGPTVILTVKYEDASPSKYSCLEHIAMYSLTWTLNRLIPMLYSYISSSKVCFPPQKPICWQ